MDSREVLTKNIIRRDDCQYCLFSGYASGDLTCRCCRLHNKEIEAYMFGLVHVISTSLYFEISLVREFEVALACCSKGMK